ncbi:MAG: hypothetical protein HY747_02680, partial [Elusimicrobia bacterium]|nr:hypothetical protein [Elusimicrobiota bacterium]
FEAFYTTKELGKGVGLGLSVCHGIVKNHKGTIFAESAGQGRGAKFTILLPLPEEGRGDTPRGGRGESEIGEIRLEKNG